MRKFIFVLILTFGINLIANNAFAELTGSTYKIRWDSINVGGGEDITGSTYQLYSTISEVGSGQTSGTTYALRAGYRQPGEDSIILTMVVEAQDSSSQTTYSTFDKTGFEVTVASVSSLTTGDYILVVENEGANQMVATGQIESITGTGPYDVGVDKWSGDHTLMSATPSGGDDYIYKLDGNSVNFGDLDTASVKTTASMLEITTNALRGYSCGIAEDGNLRNGTDDIDDVSDGIVTAGVEEYGIEKTGDNVVGGGTDVAITSARTSVASSSTTASEERILAIYKVAIGANTVGANYGHTSSFYCTVNF